MCLQGVNRPSKRTKYWLCKNTKLTSFCPKKGPIKSSPHSQLLQNPKLDYYNNVMLQFKHYLPCKLCYYCNFVCMTSSSKLQKTLISISRLFLHKYGPFIIHRQELSLKISSQHVVTVFQICSVLGHFNCLDNRLAMKGSINCLE